MVDALVHWVVKQGVSLQTESPVKQLVVEGDRIAGVQVRNPFSQKKTGFYSANSVIVATGGASYPATGSTGDGYRLAESVGHTIVPIRPALVPLETAGNVAQRLQGLSLRNSAVRLRIDGQQRALLNVRPYQFPIDTRALDNGPHRIRVQSYGSGRGIETAEIVVNVANE